MNFYTCTYPCNHHQDQNRIICSPQEALQTFRISHILLKSCVSSSISLSGCCCVVPVCLPSCCLESHLWKGCSRLQRLRAPAVLTTKTQREPCWDSSARHPQEGTDLSRLPGFQPLLQEEDFDLSLPSSWLQECEFLHHPYLDDHDDDDGDDDFTFCLEVISDLQRHCKQCKEFHSWAYTPQSWKQVYWKEKRVHKWSQQRYSP